jgi:glycylpeptide N-tetradecanoyltransferase
MAQELKLNDALNAKEEASESAGAESEPSTSHAVVVESEAEDEQDEATLSTETGNSSQASKKKKSKRKRIKAILTGGNRNDESTNDPLGKAVRGFSEAEVTELLAMNPALAKDLGIEDGDDVGPKAAEALKNLSIPDIMTGMTVRGKNVKDMASYKFWGTQPVPKFDDKKEDIVEGPFKIIDPEKVPKAPNPLPEGFEWTTLDLTTEKELKEVHDLLNGHYVEDKEAMFRFSYSESFLKWYVLFNTREESNLTLNRALMSPGWKKEWHIGVRASKSQKLVAFISAVPVALRIRQATLCASEVNFLCVHKKLRTKRLAPVLIKEITRQCNLMGISQAIYTAGVLLPTPVSTCRYFHRSLDWQKLYEVGFSPLPQNSKPQYQTRKYALPDYTAISGLRPMQEKDVDAVHNLLKRYLAKFDMAPVFTREEVNHWLLHKENSKSEQVIWSYVVEVSDFLPRRNCSLANR